MATATGLRPSLPRQQPIVTPDQQTKELGKIALSAGSGVLWGTALSLIHPLGAVIYCATSAVTCSLVNKLIEKIQWTNDPTTAKVASMVAAIVTGMAVGALFASAMAFPVALVAAIVMTAGIQITSITAEWAYGR